MKNDQSAACRLLPGLLCLLLAGGSPAPAQTYPAIPVDGEPFEASLSAIDDELRMTFATAGESRVLPAGELVRWGSWADVRRGPVLVLADGSLLVADLFEADKERLVADSALFGPLEIPLEMVAGAAFRLPANRLARDRLLDRIADAEGDSDRVILSNGDEVAGRVEAIHDDVIRLETAVGSVDVELGRVRVLVFNPALLARRTRDGLHLAAGFSDGTCLMTGRLVLAGESLSVDVAGGLRLSAAPGDLVAIQPFGGRANYLSDIRAAGDRHVPFLELQWPYCTDRNVAGGRLRAGGRLYLKGLGVHSASRLTYRLDKPYRRFDVELAIDDLAAGRGSVRFRVFVDGQVRHTSDTIRGGAAPVPASVDVTGAKRLDLVVDFADRADEQDRANWLDARLIR